MSDGMEGEERVEGRRCVGGRKWAEAHARGQSQS